MRRLEKRGLVTSAWESTTHGPPRAVYQATAAGTEVIRQYLLEVFSPQSPIPNALGHLIQEMSVVLSGGKNEIV
jgi:DNA-binding PadR family transcriptional regulator